MRQELWILAVYQDGELLDQCKELIYEAKRLAAQKNKQVSALLIGPLSNEQSNELWTYGVDHIYTLEHQLLSTYTTDGYVQVFAETIAQYRPLALFLPSTTNCNDFAPRLAARLKLPITTDCVKFQWGKEDKLLMTRFIYQGSTHATFVSQVAGTQLATIKKGTFPQEQVLPREVLPREVLPGEVLPGEVLPREEFPAVEAIQINLADPKVRTKVLGYIEGEASSMDLSEAQMIVAGGRGAGSKHGFELIHALAEVLGASVGASRVATDEGWAPFERQIGQTGKVVAPKFYIACGISGAVHHTMGIKDCDSVVCINTDPAGAIFGLSDLGLIGDMHQVLPILIEKIKAYKINKLANLDEKELVLKQ